MRTDDDCVDVAATVLSSGRNQRKIQAQDYASISARASVEVGDSGDGILRINFLVFDDDDV